MGLLRLRKFSSIPRFEDRVKKRTQQFESVDTRIPQSRIDFIQDKGRLIIRNTFRGGGSNVIYTVPEEKQFYLTLFSISFAGGLLGNVGSVDVITNEGTLFLIRMGALGAGAGLGVSPTPTPPLRFEAGDVFQVTSSIAEFIVFGGIIGYEIEKKIIEQKF